MNKLRDIGSLVIQKIWGNLHFLLEVLEDGSLPFVDETNQTKIIPFNPQEREKRLTLQTLLAETDTVNIDIKFDNYISLSSS